MNPIIIAAAILPIVVAFTERGQSEPAVWLDVGSWAVFIADFVAHIAWKRSYLRSRVGWFDLTIVALTAPWYLIPGFGNARVLGLARLGRLGRVFVVSTKSEVLRELGRRLGMAALYGAVLVVCCALIVNAAEPASSGFSTFGDSIWWTVVTFTTVGYGDLYPVTAEGRVAAVLLMVGGIALIGTLAGSLGSFFTSGTTGEASDTAPADPSTLPAGARDDVLSEMRAVRAELAELRRTVPLGREDDHTT